jgi:hypothetical protein
VLAEVLTEVPPPDPAEVTESACAFLLEVLSTFDMAHRALRSDPVTPSRE